jgi:hypothetical protein
VPLLEFSIPRHLLDDPSRFNEDDPTSSPLVRLLRARCRLQLSSARSSFTGFRLQVRVSTRTLPRVAL